MHQIYSSHNHHIKNPHAFLDALESPCLLIQTDKKQVVTANKKACELFGKNLAQIEGRSGGQVIDCVHAFNVESSCKNINCVNCKLGNAVIKTFTTAQSQEGVQTLLDIKKNSEIKLYFMQLSTEKIGDLVLVIVDNYKKIT
jgi:transcriptional regulator of aromatic amino acid metabolism